MSSHLDPRSPEFQRPWDSTVPATDDAEYGPETDPDTGPCPKCGKRCDEWLTLAEAFAERMDYARSTCIDCLLTDVKREKPAVSAPPPASAP